MSLQRAGILCGMLAPLLWAASIAVCGALRPGYSHAAQYISELGERGSLTEHLMLYAGFLPTGLLHLAFAAFLASAFRRSRPAVIGALLIGVNGLARIGAGVFPCDPGCTGLADPLGQRLHGLAAGAGFAGLIAATLLWGAVFRHHAALRALSAYSLVSGALGLAFLLLMLGDAGHGSARGLFERLSSGTLSLWILVFATRLWQLAPSGPTRAGPRSGSGGATAA